MAEYKNTLNLPTTAFPMKANLAQREPTLLSHWIDQGLYSKIRKARTGAKTFLLHDGPPYANGHLHCGHALNKILKDIIVKSKTMSGYDAPFVPGWDCHGLPIELNVEKALEKEGVQLPPREFRQRCREYAASQIDIQREEFQRLGVFGDWYNPYVTMDFTYEANILRALGKIIANGHLQQGFKPVHWCIQCGSALAEAEVDYEDKTSPSIDVAFYATSSEAFLRAMALEAVVKPLIIPIWTTTPWTLPANEAVCLHAELIYALVDAGDHYFLLAQELLAATMKRFNVASYTLIGTGKGALFENLMLQHPFYEREVPVILGDHVTTEAGTGCVHTAPAHGPDDYLVGLKYKLPLINPVLPNGCYAEDVPLVAGLYVLKVGNQIIDILREHQTLLHHEMIQHSYPHCWRHKTPMIFRATPQWFIMMDKQQLRDQLLTQVDAVNWVPDWGKARIQKMITNRPDWCVSRQRVWGTPIPLFIHKTKGTLHPETIQFIDRIAERVEKQGIDAWFELEENEFLGSDAQYYEKINDTLDVWFDSGVSHYCVLEQGKALGFPADVYFEGSDQHRGWFNSSLTTSVAMHGKAPYRTVLTHGYTVDADGKKLSKSKGNYVALDKLIDQHGADILRLWVSSTDYRNEVSISEEIIKRNADAYRRIRNTARFLLANLFDFNPETDSISGTSLIELDSWALQRCQLLQADILEAYEHFNFHTIYQKIHNFCAIDMGSFYLDIIKDRQYTTPVNSHARRSCQTAMYHIIQALTRWLAPILSFTAEEIWQHIPGHTGESIFLEKWYEGWPVLNDVNMEEWKQLQLLRDEVNKALEVARQEGAIGSGLAAIVTLYANNNTLTRLSRLDNELRFLLITSEARVLPLAERPQEIPYNDALDIAIHVEASKNEKCDRCWHRCQDVGTHSDHPGLCSRCYGNITGKAEKRHFA